MHSPVFAKYMSIGVPPAAGMLAGDFVASNRIAIGNTAVLGGSTSFESLVAFENTIVDFSAATEWSHATNYVTINPSIDITGTEVYAWDVEANIPSGCSANIKRAQAEYAQAVHGGSGTVTDLVGKELYTWIDGGNVTRMTNAEYASWVNVGSSAVVTDNTGLKVKTGHAGIGGSIGTDTTILILTPYHAQTLTTHIGLDIQDQAFGTTSFAIRTGTGLVSLGDDFKSASRMAIGSGATFGVSGGFNKIWSFKETVTDFSSSTSWNGFQGSFIVDSGVDLTGGASTFISGWDLEASIKSGNIRNYDYLLGFYGGAFHSGTGTVVNQAAVSGVSTGLGAGSITNNIGGQFVGSHSGTGSISANYGVWAHSGHNGSGGSITNDYTYYAAAPYATRTITNHYGLFLEDQEAVNITNAWAIKTGNGLIDFGDDVKGISRFAFGSDATFGLSSGYDKLWNLAATTTDFSSSTNWDGLQANWKIDSTVDLGSSAITGYDFSTSIKTGNTKNYNFITGNYFGVFHNGTGTITNQQAAIAVSQIFSSGNVTNNYGFGAIATPSGTGSATTNVAFYATSGHSGSGGSITNDYSVYVTSPNHARPMTVHRGIYLEDQAFGTTSHAIYSNGGQVFFLGNVGIGSGGSAPAHALEVYGDVLAHSRIGVGSDATIGLSGGIDKLYDFSGTITDFSSASTWEIFRSFLTLDPSATMSGTTTYGHRHNVTIKSGNTEDFLTVCGGEYVARHSGSGTVSNFIGFSINSDGKDVGNITAQHGLVVISSQSGDGSSTSNNGISIQSGHQGSGGSITTDKTINIMVPLAARPVTTHYGLYVDNQINANITNAWAIKTIGGDVEFGTPTTKSLIFALSAADVGHSFTSLISADRFFAVQPISATAGGGRIRGFSDTDAVGLEIHGLVGSNTPVKGTEAITIRASKFDTVNAGTTIGDTGTMIRIRNNSNTRITIAGNGAVGILDDDPSSSAMLSIVGFGNTSATASLRVRDATATVPMLYVRDDARVGIRTESPNAALEIGALTGTSSGFQISGVDVTHGLTGLVPTNTWFSVAPASGTAGGAIVLGITDNDSKALQIIGVIGSTDPTDTNAAVTIEGAKSNGSTSKADLGAAETVAQIVNNTTALVTILGDGTTQFITPASWTTGAAITAAAYQVGRDNAGTNLMRVNAPTGSQVTLGINGVSYLSTASTGTTITQAISTTGSPSLLTLTAAAHTTLTASTEVTDVNINLARTIGITGGALTTNRSVRIQSPTIAFTSSTTLTNACTVDISGPPTSGNANTNITNPSTLRLGSGNATYISSASLNYSNIVCLAHTITLTGTTQVTTAAGGVHQLSLGVITVTDSSSVTMDQAATLYIAGAPAAGGSVTITNPYALWVDAGTSRFDGPIDLSNISAGSSNMILTATSDTPTVTWGTVSETFKASAAPSGYMEVTVGGSARYIPFWA